MSFLVARIFSSKNFLCNVPKRDVQRDIEIYLRSALSHLANPRGYHQDGHPWPSKDELKTLLTQSDGLFIYATTSIRYIGARGVNSRRRLTEIVRPRLTSILQASTRSTASMSRSWTTLLTRLRIVIVY